jgi:hypothetical protein
VRPPKEITYTDELLADRTVHRRYSDGRQEWRRRGERGIVHWRDEHGGNGTDELLGQRIIKRIYPDGTVGYARDIGYGRTVWGGGEILMVNRTSFGGRLGTILAAVGAGALLGAVVAAPTFLTFEQEEALRQEALRAQQSSGSSGGDGGGDWDDSDDSDGFGDGDDGGDGGDFG